MSFGVSELSSIINSIFKLQGSFYGVVTTYLRQIDFDRLIWLVRSQFIDCQIGSQMLNVVFNDDRTFFFFLEENKFLFHYGKNSFAKYDKYTGELSLFPFCLAL